MPADDGATTAPRARMRAEQREQQLLDVAEVLFTDHGYEGVSTEDVARAAGVTRPIVYQRYGSREQLFVACVRRARLEAEHLLTTALAPPADEVTPRGAAGTADTAGAAHAAGAALLDLAKRAPRRWSLLFAATTGLDSSLATALRAERAALVAHLAPLLAAPATSGTRVSKAEREAQAAAAHALLGVVDALGRWWLAQPRIPRRRMLEHLHAAWPDRAGPGARPGERENR